MWMPQFKNAYAQLMNTALPSLPAPPQSLEDLPLVEVPADTEAGDTFAVFLSGDGGWAGLDKEVGRRSRRAEFRSRASIRCATSGRPARQTGWRRTSIASSATTRSTGKRAA